MHDISRRTVLAALSAPVAAVTAASGLAHASVPTRTSKGVTQVKTDWRGIPSPSELIRKSVHGR